MVRATVAFASLFLTCVNAAPAPRVIEITWLRNSAINYDVGAGNKKAKGVYDGERHLHLDLPDEAGFACTKNNVHNKTPEITVLENVNSGAGVALGADVDVDKIISIGGSIKDKLFSGKNPFWRKK